MTPDQYRRALRRVGMTQSGAGRFFGATDVTGRRWRKVGPPPGVAVALALMVEHELRSEDVTKILIKQGLVQPPPEPRRTVEFLP